MKTPTIKIISDTSNFIPTFNKVLIRIGYINKKFAPRVILKRFTKGFGLFGVEMKGCPKQLNEDFLRNNEDFWCY